MSPEHLEHFLPQLPLDVRLPGQLVQAERHRGRRGLEAGDEESESLRRHLFYRQRSSVFLAAVIDVLLFPQVDQQLEEVSSGDAVSFPIGHRVLHYLHEEVAHLDNPDNFIFSRKVQMYTCNSRIEGFEWICLNLSLIVFRTYSDLMEKAEKQNGLSKHSNNT